MKLCSGGAGFLKVSGVQPLFRRGKVIERFNLAGGRLGGAEGVKVTEIWLAGRVTIDSVCVFVCARRQWVRSGRCPVIPKFDPAWTPLPQ